MAIDANIRSDLVHFILRDLTPRRPRDQRPLDWFVSQFDFVKDESLRKHVGEAFYQARFTEKLKVALGLRGDFNNSFVKTQIILYASIYEALIDHFLESQTDHQEVQQLLEQSFFKQVKGALASNTKFTTQEQGQSIDLVLCKQVTRQQKLKEIQFKDRLATAVTLGIVPQKYAGDIQKIYDSRNSVHLIAAAAANFKPPRGEPATAFSHMREFITHLRRWSAEHPPQA